jgi:hypothetical protein
MFSATFILIARPIWDIMMYFFNFLHPNLFITCDMRLKMIPLIKEELLTHLLFNIYLWSLKLPYHSLHLITALSQHLDLWVRCHATFYPFHSWYKVNDFITTRITTFIKEYLWICIICFAGFTLFRYRQMIRLLQDWDSSLLSNWFVSISSLPSKSTPANG